MHLKKLFELVTRHLKGYPSMELQDVYKLLYQSVMGPAHFLQDEALAYSYLKKEFECISEDHETELYVDISLDHELVRLNIPIFRKKGSLDALFEMMCETQRKMIPDKNELKYYWFELGSLIEDNRFEQFTPHQWKIMNNIVSKDVFPHFSHSAAYKNLYRPSYRIVLRELV